MPTTESHPGKFVALLRAINVGPGRQVPMADLRTLCAGLGWTEVKTYIQSGNLVFQAEAAPDPSGEAALARSLEAALAGVYSFPIPVIVRSADRWRELAADRPFDGWTHPKMLSVCVLVGPPSPERWAALAPWTIGEDAVELIGDRLWLKTPGGQAETKYTNTWLEKKLGVRSTGRNRNTVEALLALLASPGVD